MLMRMMMMMMTIVVVITISSIIINTDRPCCGCQFLNYVVGLIYCLKFTALLCVAPGNNAVFSFLHVRYYSCRYVMPCST